MDGNSHVGVHVELRDLERQRWIEQFGIRFLRFTDADVLRFTEAVLNPIAQTAKALGAEDHEVAT